MQLAIPIFERLDMFLWSIKVQYFGPLLNKLDVKNLILWSCIIFYYEFVETMPTGMLFYNISSSIAWVLLHKTLTDACVLFQQDQLSKIFELCGSPNEENWPGVSKLPLYKTMAIHPVTPTKRRLRDMLQK